jgi:hypothetical protein
MTETRTRTVLRDVTQIVAVAALAGAAGAGIGAGLGRLAGGDDTASALTPAAASADGKPAVAPTTAKRPATNPAPAAPAATAPRPRVRVLAAVLYPASTDRGRQLQRAQVRVRLRLAAPAGAPLPPAKPSLVAGDERVLVDPAAADLAGALLTGVRPGRSATGELRFETAGNVTADLVARRRGSLQIAGRTLSLTIQVSPTPAASEISDCSESAGRGVVVSSAAGMTCTQAVAQVRTAGTIAQSFQTSSGFDCQRVVGTNQRGQWRCASGQQAFRFERTQ